MRFILIIFDIVSITLKITYLDDKYRQKLLIFSAVRFGFLVLPGHAQGITDLIKPRNFLKRNHSFWTFWCKYITLSIFIKEYHEFSTISILIQFPKRRRKHRSVNKPIYFFNLSFLPELSKNCFDYNNNVFIWLHLPNEVLSQCQIWWDCYLFKYV